MTPYSKTITIMMLVFAAVAAAGMFPDKIWLSGPLAGICGFCMTRVWRA